MEDGHATIQVAALVNHKMGVEWKEGKAQEGDWPGHTLENPSTPCAATQNFPIFLPLNAKRPGVSVAGGQGDNCLNRQPHFKDV
jgi:hypothetical protein